MRWARAQRPAQHHVLRLQIGVDQAAVCMQIVQSVEHLRQLIGAALSCSRHLSEELRRH